MIGLVFSGADRSIRTVYVGFIINLQKFQNGVVFESSSTIHVNHFKNIEEKSTLSQLLFFEKEKKRVHIKGSKDKCWFTYDYIY